MRKFFSRSCFILIILVMVAGGACSSSGTWSGAGATEVVINVPPGKLFKFMNDQTKNKEYTPDLVELNCEGKGVGKTCTWKTKAFGEIFEGQTTVLESKPGKKMSLALITNDGGLAFRETVLFLPHPKGTRLLRARECYSFKLPAMLDKLPHDVVHKKIMDLFREDDQRLKKAAESQ